MLKLKLQYFGYLMRRTDFIWKDPDAGKDWRQEEKGTTEDEMVGWHHWLNGHEFGWTPGVGDGQGGLVCYRPWGRRELDTTEQQNWTELKWVAPNAGQDAGPWNEISFITRKNTESTATLQDSSAIAYKTERILSI